MFGSWKACCRYRLGTIVRHLKRVVAAERRNQQIRHDVGEGDRHDVVERDPQHHGSAREAGPGPAAAAEPRARRGSGAAAADPVFQAALNQRRAEVWAAGADRLRGLILKALDALAGELDGPG